MCTGQYANPFLVVYVHLPTFGTPSACAIFESDTESLSAELSNAVLYLDDVQIAGPTQSFRLRNLEKIIWHAVQQKVGLYFKK